MRAMLIIGASKETVVAAKQSIMEIIRCPDTEQETKRKALDALSTICSVNGTTITNCTFTGKERR